MSLIFYNVNRFDIVFIDLKMKYIFVDIFIEIIVYNFVNRLVGKFVYI